MAIIWGGNYSVIKSALAEVPPVAFNGLRLALASLLFLSAIAARRSSAPASERVVRSDIPQILLLAIVGHAIYQWLFIAGLAETSASNSALIIGCTPVFVALLSASLGQESVGARRWAGVALSALGIYLVVGYGSKTSGDSVHGDLVMLTAVFCWSASTVIARPLLRKRAAVEVTGYSLALGAAMYLALARDQIRGVEWLRVSAITWASLAASAVLALFVAYLIWYTALQRLGNTRTAIYSNLVPVAGLLVAWLGFGEAIGPVKAVGAAVVLTGVALTRL